MRFFWHEHGMAQEAVLKFEISIHKRELETALKLNMQHENSSSKVQGHVFCLTRLKPGLVRRMSLQLWKGAERNESFDVGHTLKLAEGAITDFHHQTRRLSSSGLSSSFI